MHHDVERLFAEVLLEPLGRALNRAVADVLVAFARAKVLRHLGVDVVDGVQRIDLLELEQLAGRQLPGLVHLSPLEEVGEDGQRRWPGPDHDAGSRLRQRMGDCKAESAVISHPGNEGTLTLQIDCKHESWIVGWRERPPSAGSLSHYPTVPLSHYPTIPPFCSAQNL